MWPTVATPQWAIEEYGDTGWMEIGNFQTFGPYTVSEWVHDEKIVMVMNPFWPGTEYIPVPQIDRIEQYIIAADAAMSLYEAGEIEYIQPPLAEMERIKADPVLSEELFIGPQFCTYYYGFNVTKEPLDNVHLRRALSFAVDRQSLIDNVTQGGQLPAQWFSRPGLAAAPTMDTNPIWASGTTRRWLRKSWRWR
jgi:oligopeptide transport system substrate-binding protein